MFTLGLAFSESHFLSTPMTILWGKTRFVDNLNMCNNLYPNGINTNNPLITINHILQNMNHFDLAWPLLLNKILTLSFQVTLDIIWNTRDHDYDATFVILTHK